MRGERSNLPVSLVGLLLELSGAVGESNVEFFGSLDDDLSAKKLTRTDDLTWSRQRGCLRSQRSKFCCSSAATPYPSRCGSGAS